MKYLKIIITVTYLLISGLQAFADVMPTYVSTVPKNIFGFLQVERSFKLYAEPTEKSTVVDTVKWDNSAVNFQKYKLDPSDFFAAEVTKRKFAFCYVLDEQDGWYKILYDKKNRRSAWVKPNKEEDFWALKDFYFYFGKKFSLYYLKDVDVHKRSLRSAPSDSSQALQGFNVTKNIKLVIIRGNWALVSIIDYDGTVPKTGYIKWRDSDGALFLFPKLDKD